MIAEFDPEGFKGPSWQIVNDGVMGELSKGSVQISEGIMTFSGTLSLENNGGFPLVASGDITLDPSSGLGLLLFVKGEVEVDWRLTCGRGPGAVTPGFRIRSGETKNARQNETCRFTPPWRASP
jgi:hypothetical protein